jgi:hypothetical protein
MSSCTDGMEDDDDDTVTTNDKSSMFDRISPTDVLSFPPASNHSSFPTAPPTPKKTRPSTAPYASVRRHEPTTPFCERRHGRQDARTPHPGGIHGGHGNNNNNNNHHMNGIHGNGSNKTGPKSRFYGDFDIIGELGKGSFGTVYKVLSRLDGCMYAIKAAQRKAKGLADRDRMLKEVCTTIDYRLLKLVLPNVVVNTMLRAECL